MTAVFLTYLAEMLSKMGSAQGERLGQPNNMGSGQNRCTGSAHCPALAPAVLKREDRAMGDVKTHERARAAGQMRPSFSSGMGRRCLLQDTSCTGRNDAET